MTNHFLKLAAAVTVFLFPILPCTAEEVILPGIQDELMDIYTGESELSFDENETENLYPEELSSGEASTEAEDQSFQLPEGITPTDEGAWEDFTVTIDGRSYTYPMMFNDFTKAGWSWTEDDEETLAPDDYVNWDFEMDNRRIFSYIVNPSFEERKIADCVVSGIHINPLDWPPDDGRVELAAGIERGVSRLEDVIAAYGYPAYDPYRRNSMILLRYESEQFDTLELWFDSSDLVLTGIALYCAGTPKNFDPGTVDTKKSGRILAWAPPENLSDDLNDPQIRIGEAVYSMPMPVCALTEDGWEMSEAPEYVRAGAGDRVTLTKNGVSLECPVRNFEDAAQIPENCWITQISLGRLVSGPEGELAGGVGTDMYLYDLEQLLEGSGIPYESENDGTFVYFRYLQEEDGSGCEAVVYIGEDGQYDMNTVVMISSCRMSLQEDDV